MENSLHLMVQYTLFPGKRRAFLDMLNSINFPEVVRAEPGCIRYEYYLSSDDEASVILLEEWSDREHQQLHLKQPHMLEFAKLKGQFVKKTVLGEFSE